MRCPGSLQIMVHRGKLKGKMKDDAIWIGVGAFEYNDKSVVNVLEGNNGRET